MMSPLMNYDEPHGEPVDVKYSQSHIHCHTKHNKIEDQSIN